MATLPGAFSFTISGGIGRKSKIAAGNAIFMAVFLAQFVFQFAAVFMSSLLATVQMDPSNPFITADNELWYHTAAAIAAAVALLIVVSLHIGRVFTHQSFDIYFRHFLIKWHLQLLFVEAVNMVILWTLQTLILILAAVPDADEEVVADEAGPVDFNNPYYMLYYIRNVTFLLTSMWVIWEGISNALDSLCFNRVSPKNEIDGAGRGGAAGAASGAFQNNRNSNKKATRLLEQKKQQQQQQRSKMDVD